MRPMNGFHVTGAAAMPPSMVHRPTSLPHSAWHSPVPYLFGGLAAMLGLIAFALLILACSYWKLSGYLDAEDGRDGSADSEVAGGGGDSLVKPSPPESFVVIMAGDCKPTFLATPAAGGSAASSFDGRSGAAGDAAALAEAKKTAESAVSSPRGDATQGSRAID